MVVVHEEGVLEGEFAVKVGVLDACVFDNVDLRRGPAGGDVRHDGLEEQRPGRREADEQGRRIVEVVFLVEIWFGGVPFGDWRGRRGCEEGEGVFDGRRCPCWRG